VQNALPQFVAVPGPVVEHEPPPARTRMICPPSAIAQAPNNVAPKIAALIVPGLGA
jgi:hypothetical protein